MKTIDTTALPFNERIQSRWNYYHRVLAAYLRTGVSQLTFWHDTPTPDESFPRDGLGSYYQHFAQKADYAAHFDFAEIPLLDYQGVIGRQYNPIAIAQYGLGNYNLYVRNGDAERRRKFLLIADWLVENLEHNAAGVSVWMHHFDWDYRQRLIAPWYSGLAQGQGISALLRAYRETSDDRYLRAADEAFKAFRADVRSGGVTQRDKKGNVWFEEYIVDPPTHILNGFIWASWGVYDFAIVTGDDEAKRLWTGALDTLRSELHRFDTGFWSLYELSGTWLPMLASPFYHSLHITQLRILYALTGDPVFSAFADRWESYKQRRWNRNRALAGKAVFKLCYY